MTTRDALELAGIVALGAVSVTALVGLALAAWGIADLGVGLVLVEAWSWWGGGA